MAGPVVPLPSAPAAKRGSAKLLQMGLTERLRTRLVGNRDWFADMPDSS